MLPLGSYQTMLRKCNKTNIIYLGPVCVCVCVCVCETQGIVYGVEETERQRGKKEQLTNRPSDLEKHRKTEKRRKGQRETDRKRDRGKEGKRGGERENKTKTERK